MKMAGRFFFMVIFVLFIGTAALTQPRPQSGDGHLRGDVADAAENAPIKYAFVLVHSDSGKGDVPAKLDERGQFDLMLSPGLYDVFVAASGFAPVSKKIEISRNHTMIFKPRLRPDEKHLQQRRS